MLSGEDKVIGESPMAQHSPGAIEFVEDSVKCRQRATTFIDFFLLCLRAAAIVETGQTQNLLQVNDHTVGAHPTEGTKGRDKNSLYGAMNVGEKI